MKDVNVFWQEFREAELSARYVRRSQRRSNPQLKDVISFGDTPEECDRILCMILEDRCSAHIMSFTRWQESGKPLPAVDDYRIVLDSTGEPRCVLRSTGMHLVPFRQMKGEYTYAAEHPYPDRSGKPQEIRPIDLANSLRYWQDRTRPRLMQECADRGIMFSMEMLMVVDTFTVAYPVNL